MLAHARPLSHFRVCESPADIDKENLNPFTGTRNMRTLNAGNVRRAPLADVTCAYMPEVREFVLVEGDYDAEDGDELAAEPVAETHSAKPAAPRLQQNENAIPWRPKPQQQLQHQFGATRTALASRTVNSVPSFR
jgi:hypothetical protein